MMILGVAPELVGEISHGGLTAYCVGYALDDGWNGGAIYLSLLGYPAAVRAIWAGLLDNRWLEVDGQVLHRLPGNYQRLSVRLVEQGVDHLVLLHNQATLKFLDPGAPFYLLSSSAHPPLDRFVSMLDKGVRVPLVEQWATGLWEMGLRGSLIEAMGTARGTWAWRVESNNASWLEVIQEGIRTKLLGVGEDVYSHV